MKINKIKWKEIAERNTVVGSIFVIMTIGDRLKTLRKAKGLSVEKASEVTKISERTINNHETDTTEPKYSDILSYANAYGVSVARVMTDDPIDIPEAENYQLSVGDAELADPKLMQIMEEELAAIRRIRVEREKQIRSNLRSGEERHPGTGKKR